jgi:hypothetical protein
MHENRGIGVHLLQLAQNPSVQVDPDADRERPFGCSPQQFVCERELIARHAEESARLRLLEIFRGESDAGRRQVERATTWEN